MPVVPLCPHLQFHHAMEVTRPLTNVLQEVFQSIESRNRLKPPNLSFFFMKAWNPPLRTCCHKGEENLLKAQREKKIRKIPNTPRSMWKGRAPESGTEEIKVLLMAVLQGWGRDDSKVPRGRQNLRFQGSQLPSQRWTKGISCDWNRWEISCPCLNFCVL